MNNNELRDDPSDITWIISVNIQKRYIGDHYSIIIYNNNYNYNKCI